MIPRIFTIKLGGQDSVTESTQLGSSMTKTENMRMRPLGAVSGPPVLPKLWGFGKTKTPRAHYLGLAKPGGGVVVGTEGTIAVQISKQGLNIIHFFDVVGSKDRGMFFMGDDGTFLGVRDFNDATPPIYTVLAVGLDANARWYGDAYFGQLFLQNGINDAVVVQLGRTKAPGVWRTRGSNAALPAPAVSTAEPRKGNNIQAQLTIPGIGTQFFWANPATDRIWLYSASHSVDATDSTDRFKASTGWIPVNGTRIAFKGVSMPVGISAYTRYYVVDSASGTFRVSATPGGAYISFTGAGMSLVFGILATNAFANDSQVFLNQAGTLPAPLLEKEYYVVNADDVSFQLSETSGGAVIDITNEGAGNNTLAAFSDVRRRGVKSLRFLANADNFPGAFGNNKIRVAIYYESYGNSMRSEVTGQGTTAQPYVYTIFTVPGASSNNAIKSFVNADSNALDYLRVESEVDGTEDPFTMGPTLLTGGSGTGESSGWTNQAVTIYARLFDSGHSRCGYEGPSSPISNEVIISASSNKDIIVEVTLDPEAEGGRFDSVRLYMQFINPNTEQSTWNWMNFQNPIANTRRKVFLVGQPGGPNLLWTCNQVDNGASCVSANRITGTMPFADRSPVIISQTSNVPLGLNPFQVYYVRVISHQFYGLSDTPNGGLKTFPVNFANIMLCGLQEHGWVDGDVIRTGSAVGVTPPAAIQANRDYHPHSSTAYTVRLSTVSPSITSANTVNITSIGNGALTAEVRRHVFRIGNDITPGFVMTEDQNRPTAHRYTMFAKGRIFNAGNRNGEERVYASKEATDDELVPEGVDINDYEVIIKSEGQTNYKITAVWTDQFRCHLHTGDGCLVFDPDDPTNVIEPPATVGAINGSMIVALDANRIYYMGTNRELSSYSGARYGTLANKSETQGATAYITDYISQEAIANAPDRCHMMHDTDGNAIWVFLPGKDGELIGFAYDMLLHTFIGPYTAPCGIHSSCPTGSGRSQHIVADENGYLYVWDATKQGDTNKDHEIQPQITLHTLSEVPPQEHAGYMTVTKDASKLWYAHAAKLETGFFDFGNANVPKMITGVQFRSVLNSRGYVRITIIGINGRSKSIDYGEMGERGLKELHKVIFQFTDSAIKLRVEVFGGDLRKWTIRDISLFFKTATAT